MLKDKNLLNLNLFEELLEEELEQFVGGHPDSTVHWHLKKPACLDPPCPWIPINPHKITPFDPLAAIKEKIKNKCGGEINWLKDQCDTLPYNPYEN